MRIASILIFISACCCLAVHAQRTTRPRLVLDPGALAKPAEAVVADTIGRDSAQACVKFSGFEKTLRSRRESVHATNLTLSDTVTSLEIEIEYLDTKGRQLHQRTVSIDCEIPPGQTRMLDFSSWDKQQVWHYRLSKPPRSNSQANPFDVKIVPLRLTVRR